MRKFSILITVLAVALMTTGVSAQSGKTTLKMRVWDLAKTPYWQAVVDAYQAKNPNVTVELVDTASADYTNVVSVGLSGGEKTDIITIKDIPSYYGWLSRGQIIPLDDYIKSSKVDLSTYSGAVEQLSSDGKTYALPFRSDIWILYYNKAIFDAAKVDYPTNDMTWSEFDALARKLTKGSGADKIYGAHFHVWRSTVELPSVQDGKNTVIATDYSFMKPMYDMVTKMQADGIVMDYGELKTGNIHYSGPFENGHVAMLPMGTWFIGTLIAAQAKGQVNFDWGVAAYPHPDGVPAGTTAGTLTSLAINANSDNKDAAWDFVKFYTGPDAAKVLASTGNLPAYRTPDVLKAFTDLKGVPAGAADALKTTSVHLEIPVAANVSKIDQILNEEHDLNMTKSISVDDGIKEMTSRVAALGN